MTRVRPTKTQYERLLGANAHRCCVCKRRGVGFNLHHIDGNNANTVDPNLAVLCVEDHDRHHRPGKYAPKTKHTELSASELLGFKTDWENFIADARCLQPKVVATLSAYGTIELIHSLQLVMQWPDERIAMKQSYHLLDGNLDRLTDEVVADIASISPNVKTALINEPLAVEHCPCCRSGYSQTLKPAIVARLTDPGWTTESTARIYINPSQPSLAVLISFRDEQIVQGHLHLCQSHYLHYHSEGIDDRVPIDRKVSVRTQASQIIKTVLQQWEPARVFIATGDPTKPQIIDNLTLPKCWEKYQKIRREALPKKRIR